MKKKILIGVIVLLAVTFFTLRWVATYNDQAMNSITLNTSELTADSFYEALPFIADLHCDILLWNRNFFELHQYGHVDLPRMQKANVAFQAFTIVSKVPKGINIERNDDKTDQIALLSFSQLRPPNTWFSLKARALQQSRQLHDFAKASGGEFEVITNRKTLQEFITKRQSNKKITAGMLGLEGAHCLENNLENLQAFYDAGIRYIGLVHFFDNEWGGSAHGLQKGGLTDKGKELVHRMEQLNIIIDLAHASVQTIDDVLAITTKPVIVSHTGVKGACDNQRNLTDTHLLQIGRRNGLVGIGLWETAVCGTDAEATARSIKYVADKIGVDKVALGSDFDGAIKAHFDVTGLPLLVEALKQQGFGTSEIELIMGGNIRDFMLKNLPV